MAKKSKKQSAAAESSKHRDYEREVRNALDDGRGRKALGLLKEARKAKVGLDDSLTVEAYTLRMDEMLERGQHEEAVLLFKQVLQPMQAWREHIPLPDRLVWMLKLGFADEWSTYGKDPERDAAMDEVVLERLRDPQLLAHHPELREEHWLKQQARVVAEAWTLIDSKKFDEARSRLGAVGRRSPLRGWRVFLQGLIAYYEGDDAQLNKLGGRMPEKAAARPLFEMLTTLACPNGEEPRRVKQLRERAEGNELTLELAELDRLLDDEGTSDKRIVSKAEPLLQRLLNNGFQGLALEVAGYLFYILETDVPCMSALQPLVILHALHTPSPSYMRHRVLDNAFFAAGEPGKFSLSPVEEAVLLTELAQEWLNILDERIEDLGGYEECGECEYAPDAGPDMNDVLFDDCTGCVLQVGLNICRRALQLHALEETFRFAVQFLERKPNPAEAPEWIHDWREAFPDSVEPLQYAVKLYTKAELYEKARWVMDELRQRRGTASMPVADRLNILTEHALSLCQRGRDVLDQVNEILADHPPETVWETVLLDTIRWKACGKARKRRQQQLKTLAEHRRPLLFWHFCRRIEGNFSKSRLPKAITEQFDELEPVVASFEELSAIDQPRWQMKRFDAGHYLDHSEEAFERLWEAPEKLLSRYLDLIPEFPFLLMSSDYPSVFELTGRFLAPKNQLASRFWGWRAVVYADYTDAFFDYGEDYVSGPARDCLVVALRLGLDHPPVLRVLENFGINAERYREEAESLKKREQNAIIARERKRTDFQQLRDAVEEAVLEMEEDEEDAIFEPPNPFQTQCEILFGECFLPGCDYVENLTRFANALGVPIPSALTERQAAEVVQTLLQFLVSGADSMPRALERKLQPIMAMRSSQPSKTARQLLGTILVHEFNRLQPKKKSPQTQQPELPFDFD